MVAIRFTFTLKSPLNIGSGSRQGTLSQRGMLKDRDGWPYIPATLLKGRLRHAVEQVASTLPNINIHDPHDFTDPRPNDPVSHLFGTPWQPGQAIFTDCELSGPQAVTAHRDKYSHPRTVQRSSVSINRRRRVAADQRLFTTELLMPGAPLEFSGVIEGDFNQAQAGLLVASLKLIPALGRSKSAGLGWVDVKTDVQADGSQWTSADMLKAIQEVYHA